MEPTLRPGDETVVDLGAYAHAAPRRGDVVVFRVPRPVVEDASTRSARWAGPDVYVKRVIGIEGDWIELRGNALRVNGKAVSRRPTGELFADELGIIRRVVTEVLQGTRYQVLETPVTSASHLGPVRVPTGHVYVLGDHRSISRDSRFIGPIHVDALLGRVVEDLRR